MPVLGGGTRFREKYMLQYVHHYKHMQHITFQHTSTLLGLDAMLSCPCFFFAPSLRHNHLVKWLSTLHLIIITIQVSQIKILKVGLAKSGAETWPFVHIFFFKCSCFIMFNHILSIQNGCTLQLARFATIV